MITREELLSMPAYNEKGLDSLVRLAKELRTDDYYDDDDEDVNMISDEMRNEFVAEMLKSHPEFISAILKLVHERYDDYELEEHEYNVTIMEKHIGYITIKARSKEEAIDKANKYIEDEEIKTEYDSTEEILPKHVELIPK